MLFGITLRPVVLLALLTFFELSAIPSIAGKVSMKVITPQGGGITFFRAQLRRRVARKETFHNESSENGRVSEKLSRSLC